MCHKINKTKKVKSICVVTDENGGYVYYEIPIQAFKFGRISFTFEDNNADMIDDMCESATMFES